MNSKTEKDCTNCIKLKQRHVDCKTCITRKGFTKHKEKQVGIVEKIKLRKLPTIINTEDDLQAYVNIDLANMGIPFHHRNKGKGGHYRTANVFDLNGVKMAWPDNSIFLEGGRTIYVELKMPGKDLTPEQKNFQFWAIENGYPFYIIRSVISWTLLKGHEVLYR